MEPYLNYLNECDFFDVNPNINLHVHEIFMLPCRNYPIKKILKLIPKVHLYNLKPIDSKGKTVILSGTLEFKVLYETKNYLNLTESVLFFTPFKKEIECENFSELYDSPKVTINEVHAEVLNSNSIYISTHLLLPSFMN